MDPPLLGHELSFDHAWTQTLWRSAAAVLGKAPTVTAAEYPCDAFLNQLYFGIPTLVFGPCGAGPHNANEFVKLQSVLQYRRGAADDGAQSGAEKEWTRRKSLTIYAQLRLRGT